MIKNIKVALVLMFHRECLVIRTEQSNCAEENQNKKKVQFSKFNLKFWTSLNFYS
jgi:hypothetical protein